MNRLTQSLKASVVLEMLKVFFICWQPFRVNLLPFIRITSSLTLFKWSFSSVQHLFVPFPGASVLYDTRLSGFIIQYFCP